MLFMIEKKITLRLGTSKREPANYIILLPCLFQCFETATKTAMTSMFKMQHMPRIFLQWLFASRVKLQCSTARFITRPVAHRMGCIYWRDQVLQTISHSRKTGLTKQINAQLLSGNLLTNYPFNTQWLIYLFFIIIISSLTFPSVYLQLCCPGNCAGGCRKWEPVIATGPADLSLNLWAVH